MLSVGQQAGASVLEHVPSPAALATPPTLEQMCVSVSVPAPRGQCQAPCPPRPHHNLPLASVQPHHPPWAPALVSGCLWYRW